MDKTLPELRFKVSWLLGKYKVSIPNYDGGEVVDADSFDALAERLESAERENKRLRERERMLVETLELFTFITDEADLCHNASEILAYASKARAALNGEPK